MRYCTRCHARYSTHAEVCPLDGERLGDLPDPRIGTTVGGRYVLVDRVGAGGMATVYRARAEPELPGAPEVAVKILEAELARDPIQRARFVREARATHRVKHPHIVDVLDYGADDCSAWLVMELLDGHTLAAQLARGPVPPREAVRIVSQVAAALGHAHQVSIVHRDVKPENIFLCPSSEGVPVVKVLDFGLAHVRDEARLTVSGTVFGTPEYMSPEMARGAPCSPSSDLYALGVTFFEMLAGRRPFDGTLAELIDHYQDGEAPSLGETTAGLPEVLEPVVRRMLARDLSERYRDAWHLADDLSSLLHALPPDRSRSPAIVTAAARSRGASTLRAWSERAGSLRVAAAAVYADRDSPAWLRDALAELDAGLSAVNGATRELRSLGEALTRCESAAQTARGRITAALMALAREESATLRELDGLTRRRAALRYQGDFALADLLRAWDTPGVVADAVPRARAWQTMRDEEEHLVSAVTERRRAADDVAFQVAQLRGRLAAVDADAERDETTLRAALQALGAERARALDALDGVASRVSEHLRELPGTQSVHEPGRTPGGTVTAWATREASR